MNQTQTQTTTQAQSQSQTEVRRSRRDEYRGNPLLVLPMGENREFSFGVGKARAILEFLDDVQRFVDEQTPSKPTN